MKLDEMFPRKYASGADLKGRAVTLTIRQVRTEKMRPNPGTKEKTKYVLYFEETEKGVILCGTTARQIDEALGTEGETDNWIQKRITIYPKPMKVAGQDRIAIRARKAENGGGEPSETLQG